MLTVLTMLSHVAYAGIMEIRAAQMAVEASYPKQVWGDRAVPSVGPASATGAAEKEAGAKGDVVMHYSIKVDRYEHAQ